MRSLSASQVLPFEPLPGAAEFRTHFVHLIYLALVFNANGPNFKDQRRSSRRRFQIRL